MAASDSSPAAGAAVAERGLLEALVENSEATSLVKTGDANQGSGESASEDGTPNQLVSGSPEQSQLMQGSPKALCDPKPRHKRRLKSRNSDFRDIIVEERLALSGGWAKTPIVLPTLELHGQQFVMVNASAPWLQNVLTGTIRGLGTSKITHIVKAVTQDLKEHILKVQGADAREQREAAQSARVELGIDAPSSDSDEPRSAVPKKRPRRKDAPSQIKGGLHGVEFKGESVSVCFSRGKLHVAATQESISGIVAILRGYSGRELAQFTQFQAQTAAPPTEGAKPVIK